MSHEPDVVDFLRSRDVSLVVDVGANEGQYGQWLRMRGYAGRIVSFEPVSAAFAILAEHAAGDPLWEVHRCGLGADRAEATINVSRWTVFSSILATRDAARNFDENSEATSRETIPIRTLDGFSSAWRDERCFLKVDTQGFEPQVLAGADATLPRLLGVQMELPVIHLYAGTWTMSEAIDAMAARGFVLSLASVVNYHSKDPCAVVEFDCVFRRRSGIDE